MGLRICCDLETVGYRQITKLDSCKRSRPIWQRLEFPHPIISKLDSMSSYYIIYKYEKEYFRAFQTLFRLYFS